MGKLFKKVTVLAALAALVFSTVLAPPTSVPRLGNVYVKDDATVVARGAVATVLAVSSWEVSHYGPVAFATGQLFGEPGLKFVGIAGKWYLISS